MLKYYTDYEKGETIGINEEKVTTVAELRYELYKHKPGEEVEVVVNRNGKEQTIKVTLEENNQ